MVYNWKYRYVKRDVLMGYHLSSNSAHLKKFAIENCDRKQISIKNICDYLLIQRQYL